MLKNFAFNLKEKFYSNGKLLLTGEYVVLDGATALAIPTKFGQSLEVMPSGKGVIHWTSLDEKGAIWYHDTFSFHDGIIKPSEAQNKISNQLKRILQQAKKMNPQFLCDTTGFKVTTKLAFPRNWGLGTSSTLLNNIAQWSKVDAFELLKESFGGSGYDIAAAQNTTPILYSLKKELISVEKIHLEWNFTDRLFFVHLNEKQDSKEGIAAFRKASVTSNQIDVISTITQKLVRCKTLDDFSALVEKHESIIASIINIPTAKESRFPDFKNVIKSLGAWGGDFILAVGDKGDQEYFRSNGYTTIIPFSEMIK